MARNERIFFRRPDGSEGPNLRYFGFVVVALVTAHFAARFMCVAVIVLAFGADAYFVDGLRVADWKHSTLSDGGKLAFPCAWSQSERIRSAAEPGVALDRPGMLTNLLERNKNLGLK